MNGCAELSSTVPEAFGPDLETMGRKKTKEV